jgi:hypothetical protein
LVLGVSGCGLGLEVQGANFDQRFLCEEEASAEWEELLESCRSDWEEDESCGGIISYEGTLDGQPVIYGGKLTQSEFKSRVFPDMSVLRSGLNVAGDAPTYEFEMKFIDLGVPEGQETNIPPYEVAPVAEVFDDYIADGSFRMSNGFQSRDSRVVEGILVVNRWNDDEFEARFHIAYGDHEYAIDGCVHALATIRSNENVDEMGAGGETGW